MLKLFVYLCSFLVQPAFSDLHHIDPINPKPKPHSVNFVVGGCGGGRYDDDDDGADENAGEEEAFGFW